VTPGGTTKGSNIVLVPVVVLVVGFFEYEGDDEDDSQDSV